MQKALQNDIFNMRVKTILSGSYLLYILDNEISFTPS